MRVSASWAARVPVLVVLWSVSVCGQGPAFEVASIRPAETFTPADLAAGKVHIGLTVKGSRVEIGFMTLTRMIALAYRVEPFQVTGPAWLTGSQPYNVIAKMPEGSTRNQVPELMQKLLADRFQLLAHRGTKEEPVYALTAAKDGPKVRLSAGAIAPLRPAPDAVVTGDRMAGDARIITTGTGREQVSYISTNGEGEFKLSMSDGAARFEGRGTSLKALAQFLTPYLDRPVVDFSNLPGRYDITLTIPIAARNQGLAENAGILRKALEPLGLQLAARKGPLDVIVVDRLERKPSAN